MESDHRSLKLEFFFVVRVRFSGLSDFVSNTDC